jgi:hypothetical protein
MSGWSRAAGLILLAGGLICGLARAAAEEPNVGDGAGPAAAATSAAAPADPVSVVPFRAHLDAAKLEALIEPRIPPIGDGAAFPNKRPLGSGVCGTYYFDRKPVAVRFAGAGATLTISGGFGAIASPHGGFMGCLPPEVSCGNKNAGVAPVPMSVTIAADISLADDYSLAVRLQNQGVRFLEPCRLGFGGLDASQVAKSLIDEKINSKLAELQELVGRQVSVRDAAEKLWPQLQQAFEVGPDARLQLAPTGIASSVSAEGPRRLAAEMDVVMRPVLTIGAPRATRPAPAEPLPPLAGDSGAERALFLRAEQYTRLSSLEEKAARALKGSAAVAKGRPVSATSARLSASGSALLLDVETKGHGTLRYRATPFMAPDGARAGLKLARPPGGAGCDRDCADLMPAFEAALSWPTADVTAAARRALETGTNRTLAPGLTLKTDLRDKPAGCSARVDGDSVVFVLPFRGDARVDWEVEIP